MNKNFIYEFTYVLYIHILYSYIKFHIQYILVVIINSVKSRAFQPTAREPNLTLWALLLGLYCLKFLHLYMEIDFVAFLTRFHSMVKH